MKTAVIIGAGPSGLTAALELLRTTDVKPIILEENGFVGLGLFVSGGCRPVTWYALWLQRTGI